MKSWPRRNLLALLLLPVLLLGLAAPDTAYFYRLWWKGQPRHEIQGTYGQTVHIGPDALRLVSLTSVKLTMVDRDHVDIPAGYTFWRADIIFNLAKDGDLGNCKLTLVDQQAREFSPSSPLLSSTELRDNAAHCLTMDTDDGADKVHFEDLFYFVLPPDAKPQSLKLNPDDQLLPDYVRFVLTT